MLIFGRPRDRNVLFQAPMFKLLVRWMCRHQQELKRASLDAPKRWRRFRSRISLETQAALEHVPLSQAGALRA